MDRAEKKTAEVDTYSLLELSHQVAADYNAIPQMSQQNPSNPFAYQAQVPNSYSPQPQVKPCSLIFSGTIDR
ncbi:hypothetical protein ANCDUO_00058 [Ancylostoma duodenale]|uniref:Uncharacterized protein n=1 Tax=Ancylostoma duodenale TaxID=51022 RepID=A0A0C2HD11_9BILA|nr:hypothetical protein ANCDUO_00058 [Ancylostoma duodenale]